MSGDYYSQCLKAHLSGHVLILGLFDFTQLGLPAQRSNPRFVQTILGLSEFVVAHNAIIHVS